MRRKKKRKTAPGYNARKGQPWIQTKGRPCSPHSPLQGWWEQVGEETAGPVGTYKEGGCRRERDREARGHSCPPHTEGGWRPIQGPPGGASGPSQTWRRRLKRKLLQGIPRVHPCCPTFCPSCVSGQDQIMLTVPHVPSKANSSQLGRPHHPRPSTQAGGWAPSGPQTQSWPALFWFEGGHGHEATQGRQESCRTPKPGHLPS